MEDGRWEMGNGKWKMSAAPATAPFVDPEKRKKKKRKGEKAKTEKKKNKGGKKIQSKR